MEDKKLLYIAAAAVIILIVLTSALAVFFYFKGPNQITPGQIIQNGQVGPEDVNANANVAGYLPPAPEKPLAEGELSAEEKMKLEKEKQFISSYWRLTPVNFTPQVPSSKLPLEKIKEEVNNYRDFSRKINLEPAMLKLAQNGFAVIPDIFAAKKISDWENSYKLLKDSEYPIFVSADSLLALYQNTLDVVYRETEQEIFYPSLWQLLKDLAQDAQKRFEARSQKFGIENDLIAEASRQELSYLSVALKLLAPEKNQVRESLTPDNKYFTPQEALNYTFVVPAGVGKEVGQELRLIANKTISAKSPLWLYQKSYSQYAVPAHYLASEKLKNYYLAVAWLNDILFPLYQKNNGCPDCLLEEQDHTINFLTALYLSSDLGASQIRKNNWANIYKSISFFRGLEANLTYLDYQQALKKNFGDDYNLNDLFDTDFETARSQIAKVQKTLAASSFPAALSDSNAPRENRGLKLLRNRYLLETKLFPLLSGPAAGAYLGTIQPNQPLPFSVCQSKTSTSRCWPSGLDLLRLLGNSAAGDSLAKNSSGQFQNYQTNLNNFGAEIKKFNAATWHENSYLSLLDSLKYLAGQAPGGWPTFMQNPAWEKKSLNLALAGWSDWHREINLEKAQNPAPAGFIQYFPYGYLEPQPEFYARLLGNVKMIIDGFSGLQIFSPQSQQIERLEKLKTVLQTSLEISQKELENKELSAGQYDFINNFSRQIHLILSDVKKENLSPRLAYAFALPEKNSLNEYLDGLNYLIVIYPNPAKKLFFAIGPVYNYSEGKNGQRYPWEWQKEFKQ
ncbi:MAG: hypothetical protein A3J65_02750 [Candidatus Buchananbacteria bacterium RIFCSPHIGHO2_02_FULL_45_11b]|uniref:DUF3160 domain-containing protein n=1 Tax=Candidatus Buchananbacteria bacterium RIFCSPHIGHO2_02_FULL_45_11b TaxID=1797541 RepID=A0A1G1YEW9_9BACT|nr:MAG: hypothetical protein A3J65_02750 [Candidatus Buchananbacteria bacterium RIFCSPHIGHO2_02_FULL_45_11b]